MQITNGLNITGNVTVGDVKTFDPFLWLNNSVTRYSANMDGGAAEYFESNSYIDLGETCTVEYFMRASSARNGNAVLFTGNNINNQTLFVTVLADGTITFGPKYTAAGGSFGAHTNVKIQSNKWYHVAQVVTGGTLTVYINGMRQNLTGNTTGWHPSRPANMALSIGNYVGGGDYFMLGDIHSLRLTDNVAIYTGNFTPSLNPLTANTAGSTGPGVTGAPSDANISLLAFYASNKNVYIRNGYVLTKQSVVGYPNRNITMTTANPWQQNLGDLV